MKNWARLFICFLLFNCCQWVYAKNVGSQDISVFRQNLSLGEVNMEVSTSNHQAKEHFLLGLAFLHSFMYDLAIDQFKQARQLDSGFAMAYWGEAMSNKQPIWSHEDLARAQVILRDYDINKDKRKLSVMEKDYLKAIFILFSKKPLFNRDNDYVAVMAQLYKQHPKDPNIGAFYALSLMGLASDFPNEKNSPQKVVQGRALIDGLFKQFPHHTGILHYYIHYHDVNDIKLAREATPAAKIALEVMRSSSHVTHMAAHIYRRLGWWNEFNQANILSVNAANTLCQQLEAKPLYACNAENKYHSFEWLHYGYLKTKRYQAADELVKEMGSIAKQDSALKYQQWYYTMWARQVLVGKNWQAKRITIKPIAKPGDLLYWAAYAECGGLLASGLLAAHQHLPTDYVLARLEQVINYTNQLPDPYIKQSCQIAKLEVKAEIAKQAKQAAQALAYRQQALMVERQQISTELSPSLPFLTAQQYDTINDQMTN